MTGLALPARAMVRPTLALIVPGLVGLLALGTIVPAASASEEVTIDGVLHVRNGADPSEGRETLHLEELWRAGGNEDEETIFGLIADVVGDPQGNTYVLDAQLCETQVYSPRGEHLRTLFGRGEGPGEVHAPRDLLRLADGSIGAGEEIPAKIVLVDEEGIARPSLVAWAGDVEQGLATITACASGGEAIVLSGVLIGRSGEPGVQARTYYLSIFDREGGEVARLFSMTGDYNFNEFVFSEPMHIPSFWWSFAVGPDGRVYAAEHRDRYAISVFSPDGALERVIERECSPRPRTPEERDWVRRMIASAMAGTPMEVTIEIEENDPLIALFYHPLHIAADGSLWVLTSRGYRDQPAGVMATFDVFDPQGHFVKQVALACEGDGDRDALFFTGGDRVVLVKGHLAALAAMFGRGTPTDEGEEEPEPMEIVGYRIPEGN